MSAGDRRGGNPRSEEERKKRHKRLYGNSNLPARGSGLRVKTAVQRLLEK